MTQRMNWYDDIAALRLFHYYSFCNLVGPRLLRANPT
jgi:hypothetical protein